MAEAQIKIFAGFRIDLKIWLKEYPLPDLAAPRTHDLVFITSIWTSKLSESP